MTLKSVCFEKYALYVSSTNIRALFNLVHISRLRMRDSICSTVHKTHFCILHLLGFGPHDPTLSCLIKLYSGTVIYSSILSHTYYHSLLTRHADYTWKQDIAGSVL
jgi:hypothetical protein